MRPFYLPPCRLTIDLDKVGAISDIEGAGRHVFRIHMGGELLTVDSWDEDLLPLHEMLMDRWLGRGGAAFVGFTAAEVDAIEARAKEEQP